MDRSDIARRVRLYAAQNGLTVCEVLGGGVHGSVFAAERQSTGGQSAIKAHDSEAFYRRERDVYLRLRENDVTAIHGCRVPTLVAFDDSLWVIEMTVVKQPFVLDFAGANLDEPPDFSNEVMADWFAEKEEQFGTEWPRVQAILAYLEASGIYITDVNPGNIAFGE
jgi:hypothetical protein